jgi:phosphatidylglycerophosphate synthase
MRYIPNLISGCRLAAVPVLLLLAWYGYPHTFLIVTAASFASDVLDGFLARRFGQTSSLGATMDSVSDGVLYITLPLGGGGSGQQLCVTKVPGYALCSRAVYSRHSSPSENFIA